jgi:3-methyladenine DNA glycosylase AlkD
MDVDAVVAEIDEGLRGLGTAERAEKEKAYLKSDLRHYGTTMPAIRNVVKDVSRRHPPDHDELIALVESLWAVPVHERRAASAELLELFVDELDTRDIVVLERLLRDSKTWALVDGLAASVVGPLVERHPQLTSVLDRWAVDDDFWIRRSALLALLLALRRGAGDFERFGRYADAMLDEKEFFIRKAIGWVLRDTAKQRPDMVYEWLLPRARRASGLTVREAVKPLSEQQRRAILDAR